MNVFESKIMKVDLKGKTKEKYFTVLLSYKYTLREKSIINHKKHKYVMIKFEFGRKAGIVILMYVIT